MSKPILLFSLSVSLPGLLGLHAGEILRVDYRVFSLYIKRLGAVIFHFSESFGNWVRMQDNTMKFVNDNNRASPLIAIRFE